MSAYPRAFHFLSFIIVAFSIGASSCASTAPADRLVAASPSPAAAPRTAPAAADPAAAVRGKVVASAQSLLGQKPNAKVVVRGKTFVLDCIGTVSAAWWGAGYDIQRDFGKYADNGVNRLYKSLEAWGALHERPIPAPGDFVIWSNTYDRNEDGVRYNDGITHAGIVVEVDPDGTVHYLHASYSRGVVVAFFNLLHPDVPRSPEGKVWNSPMYLGSNYGLANNPPRWLSGDLWEVFGDAAKTEYALK